MPFPLHIESILLQTLALLITAFLLPRFQVHGPISGALMVLSLSFVNTYLWDAALFYSIPNDLTAQTGTTLIVNAFLFWGLAKSLPGIQIQGFLPAVIAPVVLTAISILTYQYGRDVDWYKIALFVQEQFDMLRTFSENRGG
jgi:putative membrane protein